VLNQLSSPLKKVIPNFADAPNCRDTRQCKAHQAIEGIEGLPCIPWCRNMTRTFSTQNVNHEISLVFNERLK